ncbi:MAG: nitrite/sulfite reductase, partial [Acidimicrobiia bacterium]|nr:nitrite/sulfite reductase [Acidimicrobiia bacterium]
RFAEERTAGETFGGWLDRSGGAAAIGATLVELDVFPDPDEHPEFYTDFDETGPYVSEVGAGECAT